MADDAAKWGGLELEVPPPFLEPIITAINDVLELIVVFLDIVLVVLEICKVFVLGLLGPILAVLEALIALIEALANDLRKAGFYVRYDEEWFNDKNFQENLTNMMGGFSAWESRCFNWLIDSSDPNRPDFSTASGVLGLFFYMSVDISEVIRLIKVFMGLLRFFGNYPGKGSMLQTPTDLNFEFKRDPFTAAGWSDMWDSDEAPPKQGELTWGFSAAPANALGMAMPAFPPDACILEISTIREGLMVGAQRTVAGATDAKKVKNSFVMAPIMDGGGPLRIYGGTRTLIGGKKGQSREQLLSGEMNSNAKNGKSGIWLVKNPEDPNPIYLKEWQKAEDGGDGPIMQKQVVIHHNNAMNYFFPEFKYTLTQEEMPYGLKEVVSGKPVPENDPAREVYIRIASGTDAVASIDPDDKFYKTKESAKTKSEGISGYKIKNIGNPLEIIKTEHFPEPNSRGRLSQPIKVVFPSEAQKDFMKMVKVAACIAILCRGELDGDPADGVLPSHSGFWKVSKLVNQGFGAPGGWFGDIYRTGGGTPGVWSPSKISIATAAENIAEAFQRRAASIPDAVFEALVKAHGKNLLFYMGASRSDHPLIEGTIPSFRDTSEVVNGVSVFHFDSKKDQAKHTLFDHCNTYETGDDRYVGAHLNLMAPFSNKANIAAIQVGYNTYGKNNGVQDSSFTTAQYKANDGRIPVFIGSEGEDFGEESTLIENVALGTSMIVPARNCFTRAQMDSALAVLNVATSAASDGKWIAVRPLETILLPVEEFLEKLLNWLKTVRDGLLAIIKQILDYIRMIEARILEIQQLIRKIQAILRMFADFTVSADLHMLVCTGAGTQGLIAEFMQSENKPEDGAGAVGTGVAVVAGGLPLIILDLIKAIFAATDSPGASAGGGDDGPDAAALLADEGV